MANNIYHPCCHCNLPTTNPKFCGLSCSSSYNSAAIAKTKKDNLIKLYLLSPNYCAQCNCILDYDVKSNKFCGHPCSATHANAARKSKGWTHPAKKIGPPTPRKIKTQKKNINPLHVRSGQYSKISWCIICNSLIRNKHIKTCSRACYKKAHSNRMKAFIKNNPQIKNNRNPYRQSYLEKSFEDWIKLHGMVNSLHGYLMEVRFYNPKTKKNGRADFVFPKHRIIVELDGTQHLQSDRKILDDIRDEYLFKRGWHVIRISHAEYKKKNKEQLLIDLLFK